MNKANWIFGGATGTPQMNIPSGCLYFSTCTAPSVTVNPPNRTVCVGGSTTMGITATGTGLTYQWYVNTGSGFNPISNGAPYSNATTATLTISGATAAMNGYQYQVRVTGTCGNKTSGNATLTVDVVAGTTSITPVSCNGGANGTATVTLTSGVTPVSSYSWSPSGGTGATATGLAANTYTVTITDNLGCTGQATAVVTEPVQSVSASVTAVNNISCPGGTNGNMTVTPSGGTPGYTYLWNNGATTATVFGLSAGTYTCTVRDSKNCPTTTSATVTSPAAFVTSSSTTPVSCNGGGNGTATVNVSSGGVGPYTYKWSASAGSQTTQTATGLAAGSYSCTIRDANFCPVVISGIIVTQPAALTASTSSTNVSCNGGSNGTATVIATGGAGSYSYSWSPGGGTNATATGLAAGTYTCTITDANTCQITRSITITEPAAFSISTSQTDIVCSGGTGSASVSVSGAAAPYFYSWSPSGGTGATATGLTAGTYTVSIEDFNGCPATRTFTLTNPPAITATTAKSDVSCNGGSNGTATVVASGGAGSYTYSWSPSGGTGATATGLVAGTYTVTIKDANNCQVTKDVTVTQPTALSATPSKTDVSCNGGSNGTATVMVTGGTGAYSYSWSPSGGTNATATGLVAGTYTCTITDANSCQVTKSVTVNQPVALSATASQTNVSCNGGSNGTATVVATGGKGSYTYSWSPSGGSSATATGLAAGTYTCTITDANTCQTTSSVTISEPVILSATASKTDVSCNGGANGTATVTVTGGTGSYTYSWSPSGGTSATATGLAAGTYTVTIEDANTCQATTSVTITEPAALSVTASKTDVSCNGGSNGTATVVVSGGTGAYTYSWSPSGGTNATATGLAAGAYTVTITDANTCQSTKNVTVTQPTALSVIASKTDVSCNSGSNGTASVMVTGGAGSYTYSWSPSGGTKATATGLAVGTYTCTITDANSCQVTKSVTLTQPTAMSATTSQTNVSCYGGSNGSATVTVSGGAGSYSYSWSPSGGTNATATGLSTGTYTVTVTDANSCQLTKAVTVTEPAPFTVITAKTDVSCNGGSNGSATVNVSGGTGSYTYSWSPGGGTAATASGLTAGTYTVTITDANTCQTTRSFTITEPVALTAAATPTLQTICSGEQTNIGLSSSTSGAGFSWTVSTTSGSVSGASASSGTSIQQTLTGNGVVTYTITPDNGTCTGAAVSVSVTVNPLTAIEMHPSNRSVYDEESASFSIEAANATAYQWEVNEGSGFENIANNSYYSGATTATLTVSDITGSMNGYSYRCVATGKCAPVASNSAVLSVKVRTAQTITFATTDEKVYGSPDFVPQAGSSAALELTFISSDESVAAIVDGKVHIKKAGEVTITASQAGNDDYKPATPAQQTLTIAKRQVTVALLATPLITKVYDGNAKATLAAENYSLENAVKGDDINVQGTAAYESSKAGTGKDITVQGFVLSGAGRDNYSLGTTSAVVKGDISPKSIEVSVLSAPAISKTYDGTDKASLQQAHYNITGVIGQDEVSIGESVAVYADKKAGYDKVITVSSFVLAGNDKENYALSTMSATASGDILAKEITASFAQTPAISKTYDATPTANIPAQKYQLKDVETGDEVLVSATAVYDNSNAGEDKTVTAGSFKLQGEDKDNYILTTSTAITTGDIQKAQVKAILQSSPVVSKVYDGNTEASLQASNYIIDGIIGEEEVLLNSPAAGTYDTKHGGTGKKVTVTGLELSGAGAANYQLLSTTVSGNIGEITKKEITVTAQAQTKQYGAGDPLLGYTAEALLGGDALQGNLTRQEGKNVGTYPILIGTLTGGSDYDIVEFIPAELAITPAPLTIKAEDKTKKQGTANPVFTFSYEGLVAGDLPLDLETAAIAATNANNGSPMGYYDIEVSGASSPNYTITFVKGKLTVTPASNEKYSLKVWSSSRSVLQVRIYSEVAQKASIILFTEAGQQVIVQQKQLNAGINNYSIYVGNIASSTYILGVAAEKFKTAEKARVE